METQRTTVDTWWLMDRSATRPTFEILGMPEGALRSGVAPARTSRRRAREG